MAGQGPHSSLQRMRYPDYQGGSIVNLMASLLTARGRRGQFGRMPYPEARLLPAAELGRARHIVLLVIDGLGDAWLQRQSPTGPLASHRLGALSSVFPPTTATAITTYLTGDAPQQHGMTGWYMWLQELGSILAVLPGTPRHGGSGYQDAGIDPAQLFGHQPLSERLETESVVISPKQIARSPYNLAHLGQATLHVYKNLAGMFRQIATAVKRARSPSFIYAYWPELDAVGHQRGIESPQALTHLEQIEAQLSTLLERLAGTDTLLLVSADHGQLDSQPDALIELSKLPELVDCLRIPLCGEPRAAYCYLGPNQAHRFEQLCIKHLEPHFSLHPSAELVEAGLFGLGKAHPRLHERIGDYTLIARDNAVIHQQLAHQKAFEQIGVHGGLSPAELMVPLCGFEL
ncbi:MAG: phosphodiesterase [Gammaproteobacteria bacterium]|nr:phosphodiesterase [Gammaproteobacteria bacterium]